MENRSKWSFDIPVEGICERYMTMDELMKAFYSFQNTDPETANEMIADAVQSGCASAKFEYSKFLRRVPRLSILRADRYNKAEIMLLELLNLLDAPTRFTANVALELGDLYADCLHRPVGALSLYLQAKRLGAMVEDYKLKELQKKMEKMDVNHLGSNCVDALRLGRELHRSSGAPKLTELFLREAVDKAAEELSAGKRGAKNLYGQACLALGDFYDSQISSCAAHERTAYRSERDRMYAEAKASGHPEYLSRADSVR